MSMQLINTLDTLLAEVKADAVRSVLSHQKI